MFARHVHRAAALISLVTCTIVILRINPSLHGLSGILSRGAEAAIGPQDCLSRVADGWWQRTEGRGSGEPPPHVAVWNQSDAFVFNNETLAYWWVWRDTRGCTTRRRSVSEIQDLFQNKRLEFVGDSHIRYLHNYIARTLGGDELPKARQGGPRPKQGFGLQQTIPGGAWMRIRVTSYAWQLDRMLSTWQGRWPEVLVLDAHVWHIQAQQSLAEYTSQMLALLDTLKAKVPPSTLLVWLSPPPRDTTKYSNWSGRPASWPAEWIHMFARVAGDVGLLKPAGPAHHVDLYGIALDCLPWCTREDGQHVSDTVNELALQLLANWYMQL